MISSTDWTAETIIGQLAKGNISLDPIFQRRDAWTPPRKSKFIESIILGLPIPQIVLAEARDKKGSFLVIDGKQRLLTLQQFGGVNLEEDQEPLKLAGPHYNRLDGTWLATMDSFGSLRGTFAHSTQIKAQQAIDPQSEYHTVKKQILPAMKKLDGKIGCARTLVLRLQVDLSTESKPAYSGAGSNALCPRFTAVTPRLNFVFNARPLFASF